MGLPDNHLQALEAEFHKFNDELATLKARRRDNNAALQVMNKWIHKVNIELQNYNGALEKHQEELRNAVLGGNTAIADRAENTMRALITERAQVHMMVPANYRIWSSVIKERNDLVMELTELKTKIAMKQEEIHRLEPCESLTCQHCERLSVTAFKKMKTAFKRGVVKIQKLNTKSNSIRAEDWKPTLQLRGTAWL